MQKTKSQKPSKYKHLLSILPLIALIPLWTEIYSGVFPRSWDGSGHWAIAQIYSNSIFPDTFGWSYAYFGGMPFPNFYPPVFYWLVGALSQIVSFEIAFKLLIVLPSLLIPVFLWHLCLKYSQKNQLVALFGTVGSLFLLIDKRFSFALPAGLDFFSTFQIGLYTQPLGFIFLLAWLMVYQDCYRSRWRFSLATILLALTVLTNVFTGTVATLFGIVTILFDGSRYFQIRNLNRRDAETNSVESKESKTQERVEDSSSENNSIEIKQSFLAHLVSPILAVGLTLFWLVPMFNQYEYFVTRPYTIETGLLTTTVWWIWFALGIAGSLIWLRESDRQSYPFLVSCFILSVLVAIASTIAPSWLPLQSPRLLSILNFLLVVPVGYALAKGFYALAKLLGEIKSAEVLQNQISIRQVAYSIGVFAFILIILVISSPGVRWGKGFAFMAHGEKPEIEQILAFAKEHTDGRYLVEVINPQLTPAYTDAAFDARAVNAYLGMQGNETLSAVFHEASPNGVFTLPTINSLSDYPDSFGISSVLSDDKDFYAQPISKHLERAKFLGTKYLVIRSPKMKENLDKEKGLKKFDFGFWSIYEIQSEISPSAKILPNLPALVMSNFTLKGRKQNESGYIRWVEEQFNDGWFEVLLARSNQTQIDELKDLDNFGALILETYDYSDENKAFEVLKEFSSKKLLISLSDENKLFERIKNSKAEFPKLEIIEQEEVKDLGKMLDSNEPRLNYNSSVIRQQWKQIRQLLEKNKVTVESQNPKVTLEKGNNLLQIKLSENPNNETFPILISNTFHPNWKPSSQQDIYSTTPFNQLVFAKESIQISFQRNSLEKLSIWISLATMVLVLIIAVSSFFKKVNS